MKLCILFTQLDNLITQAIAVHLLKEGNRIIGVVADEEEKEAILALLKGHLDDLSQLNLVVGSARKLTAIEPYLAHCDALIHTISIIPFYKGDQLIDWMRTRYHDSILWLEIAKENQIRKIIFGKSVLGLRYRKDTYTSYLYDGQSDMEPDWPSLPPLSTQLVKLDQAVWQYVHENQMSNDFICCYIGAVLGPCKGYTQSPLVAILRKFIAGKYLLIPNFYVPMIDIRDITTAYSRILQSDLYNHHRLILANNSFYLGDLIKIIRTIAPDKSTHLPKYHVPNIMTPMIKKLQPDLAHYFDELGDKIIANNDYTRQILDMTFIDFDEAAKAMIRDLLNH